MKTTMKSVANEIWEVSGTKVFSGNDTMFICNRFTGEIKEYQCVNTTKHEGIIIKDDCTSDTTPEEIYGGNGAHRARFAEAVITEQTKEVGN